MNTVIVVAAVLVFVMFLLLGQTVYWALATRRDEESKDLARRLGTVADKTAAPLFRMGQRNQAGLAAWLDGMLRQAGADYPLSTLYLRIALVTTLAIIVGMLLTKSLLGLALGVLGYLPILLLASQAEERARKLNEQMPDGLDLIARSLQAGHGISEAMRVVAEEAAMPLAQEFGRVYEEHNLGRDFRECLQNLTRRNPSSFDLQIFVSSVLLQRDTGGNLVEILQNIANTIRQRYVFQGKVRALTSEAKFTAWILGGLPFVVGGILMVMRPSYLLPLTTDPIGHLMLIYCFLSFSFGVFVMRDMSKVDV